VKEKSSAIERLEEEEKKMSSCKVSKDKRQYQSHTHSLAGIQSNARNLMMAY
jgi:hypothetical protein